MAIHSIEQIVILVGGLGTRLRSVVADRPKPMVEVRGKPFLELLVMRLKELGFKDFLLCTGYLGEMIEAHFGNGDKFGVHIAYSRESTPLGTAGALRNAIGCLREKFFVINGDTWVEFDPIVFSEKLDTKQDLILGIAWQADVSDFGIVVLTEDNIVIGFLEKGSSFSGLVNAGVYVMRKEIIDRLPNDTNLSLESDVLPLLIAEGRVRAIALSGAFTDIGVPDRYLEFSETKEEKH